MQLLVSFPDPNNPNADRLRYLAILQAYRRRKILKVGGAKDRRVFKRSAILAIHQSSVSRNTSELQRHCTLFLYMLVSRDLSGHMITFLSAC